MRSLELRWLARHDKELLLPAIIFSSDIDGCAGCYYRPEQAEYLLGGVFVPFNRGVIVVNTKFPELIAGTLAHEWRHHWQHYNGLLPATVNGFNSARPWELEIATFFEQPHERDALLYQHLKAADHNSQQMMDIVHGRK
jgi:hypothetical protein